MGNQKNKRKLIRSKIIEKTRDNMAKDADELGATDEEIHANISAPPPPPQGSGNTMHVGDSSSEEVEDDVSGERLAEGKQ